MKDLWAAVIHILMIAEYLTADDEYTCDEEENPIIGLNKDKFDCEDPGN